MVKLEGIYYKKTADIMLLLYTFLIHDKLVRGIAHNLYWFQNLFIKIYFVVVKLLSLYIDTVVHSNSFKTTNNF